MLYFLEVYLIISDNYSTNLIDMGPTISKNITFQFIKTLIANSKFLFDILLEKLFSMDP